ncbi:hypothetical protein HK097_003594 [Rhizophlyctis rosea]|uniref:Uncharacterized protein n=1 Tax=Rhizophlyctis rosea TaxID=64517 RepID=A0AAD5SET5_9FUNG|nr:hypothetical protein HK097_003594 [Rhizophlyctis rosea]
MADAGQVFDQIAHGDIKSRLKKTNTVEKKHLPTKDELQEAKKDPNQKVDPAAELAHKAEEQNK